MDFVVPKRRDTAVRLGIKHVSQPQPDIRVGTIVLRFPGNSQRSIDSTGLLPYLGSFRINSSRRAGITYTRTETLVIATTMKINAFRGVAGYERGGGGNGSGRPDFGQLFPRR